MKRIKFNFGKKDLLHIADVNRIPVTEEELEKFNGQLKGIYQYLDLFEKLRDKGAKYPPLHHAAGTENSFREDKIEPSLSQEETLMNAIKKRKNCFCIPVILEK